MTSSLTEESMRFWSDPRPGQMAQLVSTYRRSANSPARDNMLAAFFSIAVQAPVRSILEVGCHVGPVLDRLRLHFPGMHYFGVDINAAVIGEAARLHRDDHRAHWLVDDLTQGLPLVKGSADVVLTSSVLAHIAPADLRPAIAHLLRLAKRAVILHEVRPGTGPAFSRNGNFCQWRHHYIGQASGLPCVAEDFAPDVVVLRKDP